MMTQISSAVGACTIASACENENRRVVGFYEKNTDWQAIAGKHFCLLPHIGHT